jgi:uncharacterized alkaline shock family protein YloU
VTAGRASISPAILARYASDSAREVEGVHGLVESHLHRHRGARVTEQEGVLRVELHLSVEWGASIPDVARAVQARVREYLARMADVEPAIVDVVVDEVAAVQGR